MLTCDSTHNAKPELERRRILAHKAQEDSGYKGEYAKYQVEHLVPARPMHNPSV